MSLYPEYTIEQKRAIVALSGGFRVDRVANFGAPPMVAESSRAVAGEQLSAQNIEARLQTPEERRRAYEEALKNTPFSVFALNTLVSEHEREEDALDAALKYSQIAWESGMTAEARQARAVGRAMRKGFDKEDWQGGDED